MTEEEHYIIGICQEMCPEKEIKMRESMGLLHFFERLPMIGQQKRAVADRGRVVKEYGRPAAGKEALLASDLRPADVLLSTCRYLMQRIVESEDMPWCRVYDFVFDRLRAVRQDVVIQRIAGQKAIRILEIIVRFHLYASYRLCEESADNFDATINATHLQECLKRLVLLYSHYSATSVHPRHQGEFDPGLQEKQFDSLHQAECNPRHQLKFDPRHQGEFEPLHQGEFDPLHQWEFDPLHQGECDPKNEGEFCAFYLLVNLGDADALTLGLSLKDKLRLFLFVCSVSCTTGGQKAQI